MKILFPVAALALLGTAAPSMSDDVVIDSSLDWLKRHKIRVKRWKNPDESPYGVSLKSNWSPLVNFRRAPPPRLTIRPRMSNGSRYNYLWPNWFGPPPQLLRRVGPGRTTFFMDWPARKHGVRIAPEEQPYSPYYATDGALRFLSTLEREPVSSS